MSNFNLATDARLSQGSYYSNNSGVSSIIDGWRPKEVILKPGEKFSETFGAQLYEKDGQYKVVFRGTEGNLADWAQNFKYGTFQWSDEFKDAVAFMAKAVMQVAKEQDKTPAEAAKLFTTTGHSQGGFEAELVSKMFGLPGTSQDGPVAIAITGTAGYQAAKVGIQAKESWAVLNGAMPDFLVRWYALIVGGVKGASLEGMRLLRNRG